MNNQIEEMANEMCIDCKHLFHCTEILKEVCAFRKSAQILYNAGYRKQSEGEWTMRMYNEHCSCGKSRKVARYECSVCNRIADMQPYGLSFCPNCGANMKGGE